MDDLDTTPPQESVLDILVDGLLAKAQEDWKKFEDTGKIFEFISITISPVSKQINVTALEHIRGQRNQVVRTADLKVKAVSVYDHLQKHLPEGAGPPRINPFVYVTPEEFAKFQQQE